jgi:hypothetical protein
MSTNFRIGSKWVVTMWHFGVDTILENAGKEFEVTFGDGISDLYTVYTKRMKDSRIKVRSESQQRLDQMLLFGNCFQMVTWLILEMPTRLTNEKIKLLIPANFISPC